MNLFPYQSDVVDQFRLEMLNHKRIVVACPTGAGKTVIALHGILPLLPGPVLWITHRRELARQIANYGMDIDAVMIQSGMPEKHYSSVIIDEAHHACAGQYEWIFQKYSDSYVVALTATPYRMDGKGLGECGFSSIITGPDIFSLTQSGNLCESMTLVPNSEEIGAWEPDDAANIISKTAFNKALVYGRSVSDCEDMAKCLRAAGIPAESVDGSMGFVERDQISERFTSGATRVLCNHTIFTEGNDIPGVDCVVLNRFTHSRSLWKQMVGRGLRTAPGKSICTILDLAGNGCRHRSIYDQEVFDLNGRVLNTISRECPKASAENQDYEYNQPQELKVWKPAPKPIVILESLLRLKSKSPMHKLLIA
jgi:superfamily II DNA or RNA helicase